MRTANLLKLMRNYRTFRTLWQKLEDTYQSKRPARKALLLKNFTLKKRTKVTTFTNTYVNFLIRSIS